MSNLTLDGSTSFIGTEFIKLLATGSSNLATEEYVDDKVAEGGGNSNVDLSNYYTQSETDNLLNNKLNVTNPQDIIGTLRIDSTNGNGKLIVNAVGAPNDEDFYVNGLSNLGGTLKCQLLQASSNIETSQVIRSDTLNTYTNTDMKIQRNSIDYIVLESDKVNFKRDIYVNDVLLTGGGNSGAFSEDVVIADTYQLKTYTITSNGLNDLVFNVDTLGEFLRFQVSDNTVRVPNTRSFLSQDIYVDNLRPLTFSTDVVFNGGNNLSNSYEEYMRLDASTEKVNISKEVKFENDIQLYQGQSIKWTNVFIREVQGPSRPEFDLIVNGSTSHLRLWVNGSIKQAITNTVVACKVPIDAEQGITVFNGQELKTNIINSNGNNDLVFQQNGGEYMRFDTSLSIVYMNMETRIRKLRMNQYLNTNEFIDCALEETDSIMRFFIGNNSSHNFEINNTNVILRREAECISGLRVVDGGGSTQAQFVESTNNEHMVFKNACQIDTYRADSSGRTMYLNFASYGNVMLGTTEDTSPNPKPTMSINKFSSDTGNAFEVQGDSVFSGTVSTNTINSNGNNDLVFQRNATEALRIRASDNLILTSDTSYFSSPKVYSNELLNRTLSYDTVFYGANSTSDGRVEYMRWNRTGQSLDFNAPIDNTGIAVIGNIVDTTVSDERLKTNIEDVESNFTECVKNVKVKTFEYKDEKYKKNDKYGFIAQELQEHLPKEFNHIVKENKEKDSDDKYLSINYMKLSIVIWGALQEEINKREHIESRLFELEDIVKELKGKKTTKPKAKAKSKEKAEK